MEWMDAFERWAPGVGPHRIEEALYNVSLQLILAGGDWGFATLCPVRALAPDGTVWFSDVRAALIGSDAATDLLRPLVGRSVVGIVPRFRADIADLDLRLDDGRTPPLALRDPFACTDERVDALLEAMEEAPVTDEGERQPPPQHASCRRWKLSRPHPLRRLLPLHRLLSRLNPSRNNLPSRQFSNCLKSSLLFRPWPVM